MPVSEATGISPETLFDELLASPADHLVLCGSARIARRLQQRLGSHAAARGLQVWPSARILTPTGWLDQQWAERQRRSLLGGPSMPVALTHTQAEALWEQAVAPEAAEQALLRPTDLARLAQRTSHLARLWQIDPESGNNPDLAAWRRWEQRYRGQLQALEAADLLDRLNDALASRQSAQTGKSPQLTLVNCADQPPLWQALFRSFDHPQRPLRQLQTPQAKAAVHTAQRYARFEDECQAALAWAADQAQRKPEQRIGIVVPDLDARRAVVERCADAWLNPEVLAPGGADRSRRYNLSGGWPLARHALVHAALSLLRWGTAPLPLSELGGLLRSHYWLGMGEPLAGPHLDRRLRERNLHTVSRRQAAANASQLGNAPQFTQRLGALAEVELGASCDCAEWAERFRRWLHDAGWPGSRALSSRDYQARQRWNELLEKFAALSPYLPSLPAAEAVRRLAQLAEAELFQPQSDDSRIEILDWSEAAGLDFDAVWLLGLDDAHCPPSEALNPILPFAQQRQAGVPAANPARRAAQARRQLAQWCGSPQVRASASALDGDAELRPAAVSQTLLRWDKHISDAPTDPLLHALGNPLALKQIDDHKAPAYDTRVEAPGGARLFGHQAACPFRAFARFRLQAEALPESEFGLPPWIRGQILHRTLDSFWRGLGSQQALLALDEDACHGRLQALVGEAVAHCRRQAPEVADTIWAAEAQRCVERIEALLTIERQRPAFQVRALENRLQLAIGPLQLTLVPDRVDDINGRTAIIDYKSGKTLQLPWGDSRPADPQLLVYAQAIPDAEALAFAQLATGEVGFNGIACVEGLIDGVRTADTVRRLKDAGTTDWQQLQQDWRALLEELAQEFAAGVAAVLPSRGAQTCQHCDLQSLCRIGDEHPADDDEAES